MSRLFNIFRIFLFICIGLGLGGLISGRFYLKKHGLSPQWSNRIAQELEGLGIIADFESLTLDPHKGLVAQGVQIYSDKSRLHTIASLEHLILDVDKTKLLRGIVRVNNVSLKQADISLPLDLYDPDSPQITIDDLSGQIFLPNRNTLHTKNLSGKFSGIELDIDANIWSSQLTTKGKESNRSAEKKADQKLARLLAEIKKWQWHESEPPLLKISMEGNVHQTDTVLVNFSFNSPFLKRNDTLLKEVALRGHYKNQLITLDEISLKDNEGSLNGHGVYQPLLGLIKFSAKSGLNFQKLAKDIFNTEVLKNFAFSTPPSVEADGIINFENKNKPFIHLTGTTSAKKLSFLDSDFASATTGFSFKGSTLFLTDLHVTHPQGEVTGRILIEDDKTRYQIKSSLPPSIYLPLIGSKSGIGKTLKHASFTESSQANLTAEGTVYQHGSTAANWNSKGAAEIQNVTYRGSKINQLSTNFTLDQNTSLFTKAAANFDYSSYILKEAYGGPNAGTIIADSISINNTNKSIDVSNLQGIAWPAPLVRLFSSEVADHIEAYHFHRPPTIRANGIISQSQDDVQANNFSINISSPDNAGYPFLDHYISLSDIESKIKITGDELELTNLSFQTFHGASKGELTVRGLFSKSPQYDGKLQWSNADFNSIATNYQFDNTAQGLLHGNISFHGKGHHLSNLNASGELALENAHLFSLPLLGSLNTLISNVLGNRDPVDKKAIKASCSYVIKDGIVYSDDFSATTQDLQFTGETLLDLTKKEINILARMNAQNVFNLPSPPPEQRMGLFQFTNQSSLTKPHWKSTSFTKPAKGPKDPIFKKPSQPSLLSQ